MHTRNFLRELKCCQAQRGGQERGGNGGFTFVELLVGVTILVGMFSVGYANYRDFQRRQYLESAVRAVEADLRSLQEKAIVGVKPNQGPCVTQPLQGYTFRRAGGGYSIYANCGSWNDVFIETKSLPSGIAMNPIGGTNYIVFKNLNGGIDRTSNVTITLSFSSGGVVNKSIIVTPEGDISVQ